MIKRIPVNFLKVGMYITDLNNDWIPHNNLHKRGRIKSDEVIRKIQKLGVTELYIDTSKGLDSADAIPLDEVEKANQRKLDEAGELPPYQKRKLPLGKEMWAAERLHHQAKSLVNNMMEHGRLG